MKLTARLFLAFILGAATTFFIKEKLNNNEVKNDDAYESTIFSKNTLPTHNSNNMMNDLKILREQNKLLFRKVSSLENKIDGLKKDHVNTQQNIESEISLLKSASGEKINTEDNARVMSKLNHYINAQIESGSWAVENAEYIQTHRQQLTREQLINLQLTLNKAINNNKLVIEYDLATKPLF